MLEDRIHGAKDVTVEWYTDCDGESYWIFCYTIIDPSCEGTHKWCTGAGLTEEESRHTATILFGKEIANNLSFPAVKETP